MKKISPLKTAGGLLLVAVLMATGYIWSAIKPAEAALPWHNPTLEYRRKISFDNKNQFENLTDFTMLIRLSPTAFDYTKTKPDGTDLRFVDQNDKTKLNFHIEKWDKNSESLVWVKVPQIDASPNTDFIYMYYGSSTALDTEKKVDTYDAHYVIAQHLDEEEGLFKDETQNKNNGSQKGKPTRATQGKIGAAVQFDGIDDLISVSSSPSLNVKDAITIQGWILATSTGRNSGTIGKKGSFEFRHSEAGKDSAFYTYATLKPRGFGCNSYTDGIWHQFVATYEANPTPIAKCYRDGVLIATDDDQVGLLEETGEPLEIGRTFGESYEEYLNGSADEIRISNVARGAVWVAATWKSENGTLVAIGEEESYSTQNSSQETSITLIGTELGLANQEGWADYTIGSKNSPSADAPEGAFMGWLNPGATSLKGTITLPKTLKPGRYYIFSKGVSYDSNSNIKFELGGGETILPLNDRDANRYWTTGGYVDIATETNKLNITLLKAGQAGTTERYLMSILYLTPTENETVLADDIITDLTFPETMDDSEAVKGNLLENSSFEVDAGHGWGLSQARGVPGKPKIDNTQGANGKTSIKIPLASSSRSYGNANTLYSKAYRLKPNKKYTVSAWVKTNPGTTATMSMQVDNTFTPPAGYHPKQSVGTGYVTATDKWQRVSATGYLVKYPTTDHQILITGYDGPKDSYLWIDGIQLEEGTLTDYSPKLPVEIGIKTNRTSNLFFEDEPVTAELLTSNNANIKVSHSVSYEIYDHLNKKVKTSSIGMTIAAQKNKSFPIDLGTNKKGIFRLVAWIEGTDGSEEEVVYGIIPHPQESGTDESSIIGIHAAPHPHYLETLKALGIKWSRIMSPAAYFRWSIAEPMEGNFVWFDEAVKRGPSYGVINMGSIGVMAPGWALDSTGLPKLDKWEVFVRKMAEHYGDDVSYWEIWNEPDQENIPAAHYAAMLEKAVRVIKQINPNAKIIGMGGTSLAYMEAVIPHLWPNWQNEIHAFSTHLYPGNEGAAQDFKKRITDKYGVPVWNTETGYWDLGFYKGSNSNFISYGKNIFPHADATRYHRGSLLGPEEVAKNFTESISGGNSRYFYYDARVATGPDYLKHHPTIFEYDDTVRAKGIVYASLAKLLDHAVGKGKITNAASPVTSMHLFMREGAPVAGLWSTDGKTKKIETSLTSQEFKIYDMMGNETQTTNGVIEYGRTPIYIEGQNITENRLKTALETGVIKDGTDTRAPNISISEAPRGPIKNTSVKIRWIAGDETSSPDFTNTASLAYSYRLIGADTAWSDWTAKTFTEYTNLTPGTYTMRVKAKDAAGNESSIANRSFTIEGATAEVPTPTLLATLQIIIEKLALLTNLIATWINGQ